MMAKGYDQIITKLSHTNFDLRSLIFPFPHDKKNSFFLPLLQKFFLLLDLGQVGFEGKLEGREVWIVWEITYKRNRTNPVLNVLQMMVLILQIELNWVEGRLL